MYRFTNPPKVGDKIVKSSINGYPVAVLTVTKVTPTGIIRTEEGESFRPMRSGSPDFYWEVAPYTDELGEQVLQYQREQEDGYWEEAERQRQLINNAKNACHNMGDWDRPMSYETAVKILEVFEIWKGEGARRD